MFPTRLWAWVTRRTHERQTARFWFWGGEWTRSVSRKGGGLKFPPSWFFALNSGYIAFYLCNKKPSTGPLYSLTQKLHCLVVGRRISFTVPNLELFRLQSGLSHRARTLSLQLEGMDSDLLRLLSSTQLFCAYPFPRIPIAVVLLHVVANKLKKVVDGDVRSDLKKPLEGSSWTHARWPEAY